jgi:hypothetical protein
VVGLHGHWGPGTLLEKLDIIHQPIAKARRESINRITGDQELVSHNPRAMDYLWKNELPPTDLQISSHHHSYDFQFKTYDSPLEPLIFGTCNDELAKLTAIGFDVNFQGAEAVFTDGSRRHIGPGRHAMQYHSVDGRGGERILCCYAKFLWWETWSTRFITNRDRHIIFGDAENDGHRFPQWSQDGILMGIYCNSFNRLDYTNEDMIVHQLTALGGFFRHQGQVQNDNVQTDENGLYWNPSPPPGEFHESDIVYGRADFPTPNWRNRSATTPILSNRATVAWFDCGRPIKSVKVTLCHPKEDRNQFPLAAISFTYADDDTTKSLGPTEFSPPEQKNKFGYPFCSCNERFSTVEMKKQLHYIHREWGVGVATIHNIRVWRDEHQVLKGLQFLTEGNRSPIWGGRQAA